MFVYVLVSNLTLTPAYNKCRLAPRAGNVHPCMALQEYRRYAENPNVKLIVCCMTANEFTIADPDDPHMLDIAGFDSEAPRLIMEFVNDQL